MEKCAQKDLTEPTLLEMSEKRTSRALALNAKKLNGNGWARRRDSQRLAFAPGHTQMSHLSELQFLFCDEPILNVVAIFAAALQIKLVSAVLNLLFRRECLLHFEPTRYEGPQATPWRVESWVPVSIP